MSNGVGLWWIDTAQFTGGIQPAPSLSPDSRADGGARGRGRDRGRARREAARVFLDLYGGHISLKCELTGDCHDSPT